MKTLRKRIVSYEGIPGLDDLGPLFKFVKPRYINSSKKYFFSFWKHEMINSARGGGIYSSLRKKRKFNKHYKYGLFDHR